MSPAENEIEHGAVEAWRQLGPLGPKPTSIEIVRQRETDAIYRLSGVGPNGSAVIAKKCSAAVAHLERTIYEEVLSRLPIVSQRFYGGVSQNEHSWLFWEEVGGLPYSRLSEGHRALAGRWLGTVHSAAMKNCHPTGLPRREPRHYLQLLRVSRSKIRKLLDHPALAADDLSVLKRVVAHCDDIASRWKKLEDICADVPRTLIHGDFAAKNIRVKTTSSGFAFIVQDWAFVGWGFPATDLAQFTGHAVSPDFSAYLTAMEKGGSPLDATTVQRLAECGKIFRLLEAIAWACYWRDTDTEPNLRKPLSLLRNYADRLDQTLRDACWVCSDRKTEARRLVEEGRVIQTLKRIVAQLTIDPAGQEDLMQEGLIRLWRLDIEQPGRTRSWYLQNCRFHLQHLLASGRSVDSPKRDSARSRLIFDGVTADLPDSSQQENQVFEAVSAHDLVSTLACHLGPREIAVIAGLADGLRVQEIAAQLKLSYPTVLKCRRKIAALTLKLGIGPAMRRSRRMVKLIPHNNRSGDPTRIQAELQGAELNPADAPSHAKEGTLSQIEVRPTLRW